MSPQVVFAVAISLGLSLAIQPIAIRILNSRSLLDIPNERSSHVTATPRGGGVVVVGSIAVGMVFLAAGPSVAALGATIVLAASLGFVEDLRGVRVPVRLAAQIICALPVLIAATSGDVGVWLLWPVGALFIVGAINSVNFMDGINGITAGFGIASGLTLAAIFWSIDQPALAGVALVVVAASLGFLPYNAWHARVFLGDSGSYGIGAAIGGLCVLAWAFGAMPLAAVAPMAIYIADTAAVVMRRLHAREPIHQAHRTHVYQRLTDVGWGHPRVAAFVTLLILWCGMLGLVAELHSNLTAGVAALLLATVGFYLVSPKLFGHRSPVMEGN
ncbi:MAG: hypothetical protein WA988_17345 [Candidatus Nanopelagicales bacterium]